RTLVREHPRPIQPCRLVATSVRRRIAQTRARRHHRRPRAPRLGTRPDPRHVPLYYAVVRLNTPRLQRERAPSQPFRARPPRTSPLRRTAHTAPCPRPTLRHPTSTVHTPTHTPTLPLHDALPICRTLVREHPRPIQPCRLVATSVRRRIAQTRARRHHRRPR